IRFDQSRDEGLLPLPRNRGLPRLRIIRLRKSGKPRLAMGEGWGEGLRSTVRADPLTRRGACHRARISRDPLAPTSPHGRGEFRSRGDLSYSIGGYFGSTFISHVLSRFARD